MSETYGVDDPDEKLEMFHTTLLDCLERHAPLKGVKTTRPPANKRSLSLQERWRYILGGTCPCLKFLKWPTLHQRKF